MNKEQMKTNRHKDREKKKGRTGEQYFLEEKLDLMMAQVTASGVRAGWPSGQSWELEPQAKSPPLAPTI